MTKASLFGDGTYNECYAKIIENIFYSLSTKHYASLEPNKLAAFILLRMKLRKNLLFCRHAIAMRAECGQTPHSTQARHCSVAILEQGKR